MISSTLTVVVAVADGGLVALLLGLLAAAARGAQGSGSSTRGYWIAADVLVGWAAIAAILARGGVFASDSSTAFPVIALGIAPPIVVGILLLRRAGFRARLDRVPLHWLVGIQFYRVVGAVFLVAYFENAMPAEFAFPAGIGDVLVGLGAPFVAARLSRDGISRAGTAAAIWCVLGIADLVVAVSCGFLTSPSVFQALALGSPNAAITRYPMVLIPTFAVPVSVILHVYVLARVTRRSAVRAPAGVAA